MTNLKALREKRGITQVELAKLVGVNQPAIAHWEAGTTMPRAKTLRTLAQVLKCKIEELY